MFTTLVKLSFDVLMFMLKYPDIQVKESNEEVASDEAPFLPVQESVWKKSFNALRDHGVHTALEHIANSEGQCS